MPDAPTLPVIYGPDTDGRMPYEFYIDFVTKRYFHGVDNKILDMVLACFNEDAVLREMTTGTVHTGRDTGLKRMFTDLFANNGRIWHGNFVHTADAISESICTQFTVEIEDLEGTKSIYQNCNRFYLKDGHFDRVFVYMSGDNLLV